MPEIIQHALSLIESAEFYKFITVGIICFLLQSGIFWVCYRKFGFLYQNAATASMISTSVVNFVLHKFWTFEHPEFTALITELPLFSLKSLVFWYTNRRLLRYLVEGKGWHPLLAQAVLIPVLAVLSFLLLLNVVFSP